MDKKVYDLIKETLYHEVLDNGLNVYLVPKNDYNKTFAVFTVNYGSLDNKFVPYNSNEIKEYPLGIAHFLEHKLFEMEGGIDAMNLFLKYGASSNAFTSFNQTSYLFSTTSHVKECMDILLNFVQEPYFTDENVKKEQGIIGQEIMMYQDYADYKGQFGALENLYQNNFIKNEIVGSIESISKITKEMLYECYYTHYHPKNMELYVVGNFNLDEIITTIKDNQKTKSFREFKPIKKEFPTDEFKVVKSEETIKMDVALPKLNMGYRLELVNGNTQLEDLKMGILLSILMGDSSSLREELMNKDLINDSFGWYNDLGVTSNYIIFSSDTSNVIKLEKILKEFINNIPNYNILEEDFNRVKKAYIGRFINLINSLEGTATNFSTYSFMGNNIYEIVNFLIDLKLEDLEVTKNLFKKYLYTKFVIIPNEE